MPNVSVGPPCHWPQYGQSTLEALKTHVATRQPCSLTCGYIALCLVPSQSLYYLVISKYSAITPFRSNTCEIAVTGQLMLCFTDAYLSKGSVDAPSPTNQPPQVPCLCLICRMSALSFLICLGHDSPLYCAFRGPITWTQWMRQGFTTQQSLRRETQHEVCCGIGYPTCRRFMCVWIMSRKLRAIG